jgi:O-antigen/teichoic acid export membrane protein
LRALGRILGIAVGALVFVITTYWLYARHFIFRFSKNALLYAVAFGAPVVVHLLMATMHNAIDRIILERYVPLQELGFYTLGFTIGGAMQLFVTAFNQAYQPNFFQLMSSGRKDIGYQVIRTFKLWLVLITGVTVVGIIFGGPFLKIFAGPEFVATIEVFPFIILAFFFGSFYFFFSSPIFYFKKTKWLPLITGSSAGINIVLNFLFIPQYGIIGAAIATVISHGWTSLITFFIGNRFYKTKWPIIFIIISIIFVLASFIIERWV